MSKLIATLTREGYRSDIIEEDDGRVHFKGDADTDGDGGYRTYHPISSKGLDDLSNAHTGNDWYGCVTVNGEPVVQGPDDPAPGFYVSATSLHLPNEDGTPRAKTDPRKYVDSEKVKFIVVPPQIIHKTTGKVVLGCKARVTRISTGKVIDAVVADSGPSTKDGELSIAAALALGVISHPTARVGCDDVDFLYELWPGVPAVVDGVTYPLQGSNA